MWSSKVQSDENLISYYQDAFGGRRDFDGQLVNAKVNFAALQRLIELPNISNVLDVGTGYGFLISELQKRYRLDATGVELSTKEAAYAQSVLGLNVVNTALNRSGLRENQYDLVTSFEVIEHVPFPLDFVRELTRYVRPNGYLLIMTDNFESRMAKLLGPGFPKWIPDVHISHFSAATFKATIERVSELVILESISYTPWEVLVRALYYRLRGIRKSPSEAWGLSKGATDESDERYKLFILRKLLNGVWAKYAMSNRMDGDLMYFLMKRSS